MRVSVERLRVGLLAGAGLLVLVTAAFLGIAHYRASRFLTDLPKKLGVDIRQETNAFTYSQSNKGRTVFTIHAAKAIQHKDGAYTLHDVGIVLYGQGTEQPNRVDRIYGKQFEYDQKNEVIRAVGLVHIDLQAPASGDAAGKMDYAAGNDLKGSHEDETAKDERLIHVTTSGLVYMRQLAVAATDQQIDFEYNGLTGHARGAEYNSDTGLLLLRSAVQVNGLQQGKPVVLTANAAQLDRVNHRTVLENAKYVSVGSNGAETAEARHAVVHMRNDGSAERLEAAGAVTLTNGTGGRVVSEQADVLLNAQSQPQSARMFGGVTYSDDEQLRQAQGSSREANATFDGKGRMQRVVLNGAVVMHEKENVAAKAGKNAKDTGAQWSERDLKAEVVELGMAPDEAGKPQLRDAKASGGARLNVVDPSSTGKGTTSSAMNGDVLTAHFVRTGGTRHLSDVHGDGHTALKQVSETGAEDTSSGDSLDVTFKDAAQGGQRVAAAATVGGVQGGNQIASAVQQGNVVLTRKPVAKPGEVADLQRATAKRAVFDGDTQKVTLTGGVELSQTGGELWADHVVMDRVTGDADAEGGVKANYRESEQSETAHVLAQRAELKKASDLSVFYGAAGKMARLWQGGSQVEAPVLEFMQKQRSLSAHGAGQGAPMAVHTVLVSSGGPAPAAGKTPAAASTRGPSVVRVASRDLTYSDEKREADFTGGVLVESADGRMRGQQAVAYLQPAGTDKAGTKKVSNAPNAAGAQNGLFGGSVERVVVTGQIKMDQPGRSATGEQLVYTAGDGLFVLTGGPGAPPKVIDETRGTVTGTELRFHSGDESIVISNENNNGAGQRVHTETRVKR